MDTGKSVSDISGGSPEIDNVVIKTILSRRSVRSEFCDKPVPNEITRSIIACGLNAPSSKNAQPWKLHVVTDQSELKGVAKDVLRAKTASKYVPHDPVTGQPRQDYVDTVDESAHVLGNVPLGIFLENRGTFSVDRETIANARVNRVGAIFGFGLEYIGLGACIENMWLAAEAYGLRAVFMGDAAIAEEQIRERLKMSGDFIGVLAVGYSELEPNPKHIEDDCVEWH